MKLLLCVLAGVLLWVAPVPFAQAEEGAFCERPLLDPSFTQPAFDSLKIVSVSFESGLSASKMATAIKELRNEGFQPLGSAERGHAWVGQIDPIAASHLSKIDGIESITRASRDGLEVWRDGAKRQRAAPEEPDSGTDEELWSQLRNPIRGAPPRDLPTIRKVAREKGVTIVLSDARPADAKAVAAIEELWGARVFFAGDLRDDTGLVQLPGVVLHIEPSAKALNVRGELSILLGHGRMFEHLNKVTEAEWVHGIDPDAMSPTARGSELLASKNPNPELVSEVSAYLKKPDAAGLKAIRAHETDYLASVVAAAKTRFPPGAFFKGKFDYATRESGGIINTMSMDTAHMAGEYAKALRDFAAETPKASARTVEGFDLWLRDSGTAQATMSENLLVNPDDVLVQQKLDIAVTAGDSLMEFRVDVFEGHAVNASFRYGMEYHPNEEKGAEKMVQAFFDKAPEKDRYFTGGLDVALQRDGSYKIIETNPGSESSFINSGSYPIPANEALGHLLGRRTPLMRRLEAAYAGGPAALSELLAGINKHPADPIESIRTMSKFDLLGWIRDKYLVEWAAEPTAAHRRALLARMRKVATVGGAVLDEDFEYYIIGRMKESMRTGKKAAKAR